MSIQPDHCSVKADDSCVHISEYLQVTAWGIYVDPVGVCMAIFVCVVQIFMAF